MKVWPATTLARTRMGTRCFIDKIMISYMMFWFPVALYCPIPIVVLLNRGKTFVKFPDLYFKAFHYWRWYYAWKLWKNEWRVLVQNCLHTLYKGRAFLLVLTHAHLKCVNSERLHKNKPWFIHFQVKIFFISFLKSFSQILKMFFV